MPDSPEAVRIRSRLAQEQIQYLYHWTHVANIPTIASEQAICSKAVLEARGLWPPPRPGGNARSHNHDRDLGNWDKVSLNFAPRNPFVHNRKREEPICFFRINPRIAGAAGVAFTQANAASPVSPRAQGLAGLDLVDFAEVRARPKPWEKEGWHKKVQAEALIPALVPMSEVIDIRVISNAMANEVQWLWGAHPHPPIIVDKQIYSDLPDVVSIPFAYYEKAEMIDLPSGIPLVGAVSRSAAGHVQLSALVHATPGTTVRLAWTGIGREPPGHTFAASGDVRMLDSVQKSALNLGTERITLYLDGKPWTTVELAVEA